MCRPRRLRAPTRRHTRIPSSHGKRPAGLEARGSIRRASRRDLEAARSLRYGDRVGRARLALVARPRSLTANTTERTEREPDRLHGPGVCALYLAFRAR